MKKGNQKRKGNSYEIKISRILSNWYCKNFLNEQSREDFFWRTAGSGAKSTITKRGESSFVGDITFLPDPNKLLVWIDVKDRKTASINNLLSEEKNTIINWYYEELLKRDKLYIKKPILIIFKLYRKKENYILFNEEEFLPINRDYLMISREEDINNFVITKLIDFLEDIKPNDILKEKVKC